MVVWQVRNADIFLVQGEVWKELRAAGVDLINTDDRDGLQKFLNAE